MFYFFLNIYGWLDFVNAPPDDGPRIDGMSGQQTEKELAICGNHFLNKF
jgi:hypothetical protein